MADDDAKLLVRDLIEEVWRKGDLDRLPSFFTESCVNHGAPAGQRDGLDALRRYHESFAAAFADFDEVGITIDD